MENCMREFVYIVVCDDGVNVFASERLAREFATSQKTSSYKIFQVEGNQI